MATVVASIRPQLRLGPPFRERGNLQRSNMVRRKDNYRRTEAQGTCDNNRLDETRMFKSNNRRKNSKGRKTIPD